MNLKILLRDLGFKYAFGQHSGVIDETKDFLNYQDFLLMKNTEKLKRFKTLQKTLPLKYEKITPEEKYLLRSNNPPVVKIEFFKNKKNLKKINCYSNEENKWRNLKSSFIR